MNRRNLIKGMGVVALYSSFPAVLSQFLSSCHSKEKVLLPGFFSPVEFNLLEAVSDILLPRTATPGALDARVPFFIDLVVKDCMNKDDQQLIKKGLQQINDQPSGNFSSLSSREQSEIVKKTDEAAFKDESGHSWFRIIKKLALIGYFTSQEGMTKALSYVKIPGEYKACIPYKKGEKAMAKTFLMYW